jgi:hypothetical protein
MSGAELDLRITGTERLRTLSRAFREQGSGGHGFRKEVSAAMRRAGLPLVAAVKVSAASTLPKRGGLAAKVAGGTFAIIPRTDRDTLGITILARGIYDTPSSDAGRLHHPTYGHRDRMVTQEIKPGWFSKPMKAATPAARRELKAAMADTAKKITRSS